MKAKVGYFGTAVNSHVAHEPVHEESRSGISDRLVLLTALDWVRR
jgi:hypothetical protein